MKTNIILYYTIYIIGFIILLFKFDLVTLIGILMFVCGGLVLLAHIIFDKISINPDKTNQEVTKENN